MGRARTVADDGAPAPVDRRKVTMRSVVAAPGGDVEHLATDYVPVEILDAYVADARTRWQDVQVGDDEDHGPGGKHGRAVVPDGLDHPLAGTVLHEGAEG